MFKDAHTPLTKEQTQSLLDRINPLTGESASLNAQDASVLVHSLPFYPGYNLASITAAPEQKLFAIYNEKTPDEPPVFLDWTNAPIYALNARVPLKLDKKTVAGYVRFFFTYVRGQHGRFLIAENTDDIKWREEPPPAACKAVAKMLEPLSVKDTMPDGTFVLDATMIFRDSLFRSRIHVKPDGLTSLSGEELLIGDMPVLDDTFGQ